MLISLGAEELIKWRAVAASGYAVDELAVMRQLMWNLNDESGGIGWGVPEAMGEIMARNSVLAEEYASLLISYLREDGNFLEMEPLQRGVLGGLHRLSKCRPDLVRDLAAYVRPYLVSGDPALRGLAALLKLSLSLDPACPELSGMEKDEAHFAFFENGVLRDIRLRDIFQARDIPR